MGTLRKHISIREFVLSMNIPERLQRCRIIHEPFGTIPHQCSIERRISPPCIYVARVCSFGPRCREEFRTEPRHVQNAIFKVYPILLSDGRVPYELEGVPHVLHNPEKRDSITDRHDSSEAIDTFDREKTLVSPCTMRWDGESAVEQEVQNGIVRPFVGVPVLKLRWVPPANDV